MCKTPFTVNIIARNHVGQQTCEAKGPKLEKNEIGGSLFLLNSSKNLIAKHLRLHRGWTPFRVDSV